MMGGWLQTGSRSNSAVYIGSQAAAAADNVMVIVSHACLIASGMAGWLDASNKSGFFENVQIVVYCLRGERAEPLAGCVCNSFRIAMLPLAHHQHEHGESGSSNS